jgi:hypothetical protein
MKYLCILFFSIIICSCSIENASDQILDINDDTQSNNFSLIKITGIVDVLIDPSNDTNGSIQIGSIITGFYKINSNVTEIDNSQLYSTTYWDAVNGGDLELKVGDYKFTAKKEEKVQLSIYNNAKSVDDYFDSWSLHANFANLIGPSLTYDKIRFSLGCTSYNNDTINSTNYFIKPELSDWNSNRVSISVLNNNNDYHFNISGDIQSLRY